MWNNVKLTMRFTTPLCGGLPRDEELVMRHAERRTATDSQHAKLKREAEENERPPPQSMTAVMEERAATVDAVPDDVEEQLTKIWVGFASDDMGLFVPGRNVRAHLKDLAGVIAKPMKNGSIPGLKEIKNFRAKFVDAVYVKEPCVYILDAQGEVVT